MLVRYKATGAAIIYLLAAATLTAQQAGLYPYFPAQGLNDDWKVTATAFASEASGSNTFTNAFVKELSRSGYIDSELKEDQLKRMNGHILTGTLQDIGGGVYIRSGRMFYYAGVENHHVMDSRIGSNLARVLLLGNKPFAGTVLEVAPSDYLSIYFNQLKLGIGTTIERGEASHAFIVKAGITTGQNYDRTRVDHASIYTHPDGDYLDLDVQAGTKVADTVWAGVFDFNGVGMAVDLEYSMHKENDFYFSLSARNLGFIRWNGNTFLATVDTAFRFEGVSMDTITSSGGEMPDDYSYKNLRNILFKNPSGSPFNTATPPVLNFSGGKYFAGGKFYAGVNASYYPTLWVKYNIEVFATWNHRSLLQLTPVISYGAYGQVHLGLTTGLKLNKNLYVQAGTAFIDSFFIGDHPAGRGGFIGIRYTR